MLHWLIHIGAIINFGYAIYWDYKADIPAKSTFGGQFKYLTYINLWIQLFYFAITILNNLFGSHSNDRLTSSSLQKIRDYFFATLGFPIGQFVGEI